jgi:hypothetical protein
MSAGQQPPRLSRKRAKALIWAAYEGLRIIEIEDVTDDPTERPFGFTPKEFAQFEQDVNDAIAVLSQRYGLGE